MIAGPDTKIEMFWLITIVDLDLVLKNLFCFSDAWHKLPRPSSLNIKIGESSARKACGAGCHCSHFDRDERTTKNYNSLKQHKLYLHIHGGYELISIGNVII